MKILYDHQAFSMQKFGGISKCFCELITHLPSNITFEIGVKQSNNIHLHESGILPNLPYSNIDRNNFIINRQFRGKGRLYDTINKIVPFFPSSDNINRKYSLKLLKEKDFDIFHPTYFDDYFLPYIGNKPYVLTIHDMMPELFPQYFKRNDFQIRMKKKLVNNASAIIAVSYQTKKDIIELLNIPENKITVIHHGGPKIKTIDNEPIINDPYFLYIGTRDLYKNFTVLLKDFSQFIKLKPQVKLVCTGKEFSSDEIKLIKSLNIYDSLIYFPAKDSDLPNLYANAIAFIYPSLYEGFGMPILEAYAYSCPVLLNNRSCFPEIAGESAIYFDADEKHSNIKEKLLYTFDLSTKNRQQLIELGKQQHSLYSWKIAAEKLVNVYNSLL